MSDVSSEDLQEAKLDRYGFIVSHKFLDERKTIVSPAEMRRRSEKERERTNKWVKMIKQWDLVVTSKREKLKRRIRKGIPDMVRGTVWYRLAHCDEIQQKHPDPRRTINVRSLDPKIVDEIDRDVDRTFPRHVQFEGDRIATIRSTRNSERSASHTLSNGSLNSLVLSSDGSNAAVLGSGEAISTDQDGATPSPISGSKLMNALAKTFSGKKQMQSGESSTVKANDGASTVVGLANNGGLNSSKVVSNAGFDSSNTFDVVVQVGDSKGQHALRNLMQWYAVLDPEVGYCQGMGFIAALLLTYLIEEHAFYCFYSLMTRPTAPLRLLFLPHLAEVQKILYVFGRLGKLHLGRLWVHMEEENVHPTMYLTEWIMTMFCRGFHFDLVTHVFDIFIGEGTFKIVYRVCLALVKSIERGILSAKFEGIMTQLKALPQAIDAPTVIKIGWELPLKAAQIKNYELEHEQRLKAGEK